MERLLRDHPALSAPSARHLARFHGSDAFDVLAPRATIRRCSSRWRPAPRRSRRRCPGRAGRSGRSRPTTCSRAARPSPRSGAARRRAPASRCCCDERALRRRARPGHHEQPLPALRRAGRTVAGAQQEHRQIAPRPGWVEHDADEILQRSRACIGDALAAAGATPADLAAIGIANQRETVVLWERESGRPLANAIVWQDTRSAERVAQLGALDRFREQTGPAAGDVLLRARSSRGCSTRSPARAARAEAGELAAGTIDSWLAWHLAGVHVTDVTNASRTLLMDLRTLDWDDGLLDAIGIPRALLAEIVPSSGVARRDRRRAAGRAARRPAGGALRPVLLRAGRGQVHLRHRQLPACSTPASAPCPRVTA